MPWFRRKESAPPEKKSLSGGGIYFGTRLLSPAAASYGRLAKEGAPSVVPAGLARGDMR